jgi:hypothetical protein
VPVPASTRTLRFALLLAAAAASSAPRALSAQWTPPDSPDPVVILREAADDAEAGQFEAALAKQLWFHEHALEIEPALVGVRLSYAVGQWMRLGERFPPAKEALEAVAAAAEAGVRSGTADVLLFNDLASINLVLGRDRATTDTFVWLDANHRGYAARVYLIAEPSLVRAKLYKVAGSYLDPGRVTETLITMRRTTDEMVRSGSFPGEFEAFARRSFVNRAATLVALLAVNDRTEEAERSAVALLAEWPDDELRAALDAARKGVVPEPWP